MSDPIYETQKAIIARLSADGTIAGLVAGVWSDVVPGGAVEPAPPYLVTRFISKIPGGDAVGLRAEDFDFDVVIVSGKPWPNENRFLAERIVDLLHDKPLTLPDNWGVDSIAHTARNRVPSPDGWWEEALTFRIQTSKAT